MRRGMRLTAVLAAVLTCTGCTPGTATARRHHGISAYQQCVRSVEVQAPWVDGKTLYPTRQCMRLPLGERKAAILAGLAQPSWPVIVISEQLGESR